MLLRNQQLNGAARREFREKLFDDSATVLAALTLSNVFTTNDEDDIDIDTGKGSQPSSIIASRTTRRSSLRCDFLLRSGTDATTNNTSSTGESRIEQLTIERCRLDLEGARVLGKALRCANNNHSAISSLRSLIISKLTFVVDDENASTRTTTTRRNNDDDDDECECECECEYDSIFLPILQGIAEAGQRKGSCLESIEFRNMSMPKSPAVRRRFYSALGKCANLKSLRLINCGIQTKDAPALRKAVGALSDTLVSLNLSKNDICGSGLGVLLSNGNRCGDGNEFGNECKCKHKCSGLNGHNSLRRLVLSHNPIGDDGAIHLARFFSRTPARTPSKTTISTTRSTTATTTATTTRIESLCLVDCDVWSAGCSALSKGLKDFDTLSELVVDGEWENTNHLEEVVESLRTNVVLKQLRLVSNNIVYPWYENTEDCCGGSDRRHQRRCRDRIDYYLALNRSHRRISIDPGLSFRLWPTVLARAKKTNRERDDDSERHKQHLNDADIWYHLLQRRPELVAASVSA